MKVIAKDDFTVRALGGLFGATVILLGSIFTRSLTSSSPGPIVNVAPPSNNVTINNGPQRRVISPTDGVKVTAGLRGFAGQAISIQSTLGDNEALQLATQLKTLLVNAGWQVVAGVSQVSLIQPAFGIQLQFAGDTLTPALTNLVTAVRGLRLEISTVAVANPGAQLPILVVGSNP